MNNEIYRLTVGVEVKGTEESKSKLTAMERMTEQTQKKMKALDKISVSPSAKLNDQASSKLDKLESKVSKLKSENVAITAKIKDEITPTAEKIQKKTEKLKASNPTIKIKAKDEASTTLGKIDNKISSWLKIGAKKVISVGIAGTLALGGLGIGSAIKTFSSYEQGLSGVKAVTNATDIQMKQLGDTAKSLGASTAWSASETVKAEELLGQAGFSVSETITALPGLLSLASAGGLDLAAATDIASGTLRAFNLNASDSAHVADVLALSASATNSDVTDLGETMKYCAPVSQALAISLEDTAAASGLLSNANIKAGQAGTILRQTMVRLASPTKEAAALMDKYKINAFDAQGNMKPLSSVVDNLNSSLSNLTSQQRADVISNVFGTESLSGVLALMNQGGQSLSNLSTKLKEAKGSADKMAETRLDNLAGQWEQLKGATETMQINLGEKLAPYAKQFVTWLTGKMPAIEDKVVSIVDYLSKNTGTIKTIAASIAGIGVAFAGLSAISTISTGIAGLKAMSGLLGGLGVASAASATATTATAAAGGIAKMTLGMKVAGLAAKVIPALLSPAGLAIAAIGVVGIAAAHELSKEVIPKVDLFANRTELSASTIRDANGNIVNVTQASSVKISDATKKNVGAYMEMDNKVQKALLNMRYSNTTITKDIVTDISSQFSQMGITITTELDKDLQDSIGKMETFFSKSSALTSEQQADIITQLQGHYANQKTNTQSAVNEISKIYADASQANRATTQEENAEIDRLKQGMKTSAITALSETEKESAAILGRIKDADGRLTAETASEHVKALEDQRIKTIDAANIEYAERTRISEAIRSEGGEKANQTADAIITEAQRQRDEVIKGANDTKTQGIDVLKQSYTDLENNVNTSTGAILTWWDRLAKWWNSHTFANKTATITTTASGTIEGAGSESATTYTNGYANQKTESPTAAINYNGGYATQPKQETGTMVYKNGYLVKENYTGTDNATVGLNSVAERGAELVFGRKFFNFKGGEKVLNNKQTTDLLSSTTPSQSKQGQFQLFQPQMQVAGAGGVSVGDIQVSVNGNQDSDSIVQEVVQVVGYKLKEALTNIKK